MKKLICSSLVVLTGQVLLAQERPNMERMAQQGIRFSTFYAQSVSSPSSASLMTGQNAARHRTTTWINSESNNRTPLGPKNWNWNGISGTVPTLPRMM